MNPCDTCKHKDSTTACPYAGTRGSGKEVNGCREWEFDIDWWGYIHDSEYTALGTVRSYARDMVQRWGVRNEYRLPRDFHQRCIDVLEDLEKHAALLSPVPEPESKVKP